MQHLHRSCGAEKAKGVTSSRQLCLKGSDWGISGAPLQPCDAVMTGRAALGGTRLQREELAARLCSGRAAGSSQRDAAPRESRASPLCNTHTCTYTAHRHAQRTRALDDAHSLTLSHTAARTHGPNLTHGHPQAHTTIHTQTHHTAIGRDSSHHIKLLEAPSSQDGNALNSNRAKGTARSCVRGGSGWISRNRCAPEGGGHGAAPRGSGCSPELPELSLTPGAAVRSQELGWLILTGLSNWDRLLSARSSICCGTKQWCFQQSQHRTHNRRTKLCFLQWEIYSI